MRLIDADSLVTHEELESFGNGDYDYEFVEVVYKDDIDNAPTIKPERPKGKWIPQNHNKTKGMISTALYYFPKCSVCGQYANSYTNFCPNCGADMREDEG